MQVFGAGEKTSHVLQSNTIQTEEAFAHEIRKCSKVVYHVVALFYICENGIVARE